VPPRGATALQGLATTAGPGGSERADQRRRGRRRNLRRADRQGARSDGEPPSAARERRARPVARARSRVDYAREDFTRAARRYDVMFDNAGNRSWSSSRRVLAKEATVVLVGGSMTNRLLGPLGHIIRSKLGALRCSQKAVFFIAKPNNADLAVLRELIETGKIQTGHRQAVRAARDRRRDQVPWARTHAREGRHHAVDEGSRLVSCHMHELRGREPGAREVLSRVRRPLTQAQPARSERR